MKEQHIELEHTASQNLSFYRQSDGHQSVQIMREYYLVKEEHQPRNKPIEFNTHVNINTNNLQGCDYHTVLDEVFHFKRKNRKNLFQKARSFFRTSPDEFKELDTIMSGANAIADEGDRLDAITHLSMYVDEMVDNIENQCISKAGFLTLIPSFIWFMPSVSHITIIHAEHPFLWNFVPPVIALSLIISIGAGVILGGKYFARKNQRLQKYTDYAKKLDQALQEHSIIGYSEYQY